MERPSLDLEDKVDALLKIRPIPTFFTDEVRLSTKKVFFHYLKFKKI